MKQTHYVLLGVAEDADAAEIRSAYHAKMRTHHPDLVATGQERAYDFNAAYSILSNPTKRAEYDRQLLSERSQTRVVVPGSGGRSHHRHAGPINTAERLDYRPPGIVWLMLLAIALNLVLLIGIYLQGGFD